jgi:CarD family transcriptional regulator
MAQKKKVSVSSVASSKAKEVKKTTVARTKSTATKKTATKPQTKSKAPAAKKTAAPAKKTTTAKTTAKKPAEKRASPTAAARKAPAKTAAAKPTAKNTAPTAKTKASSTAKSQSATRAKIAAAAKKVAARKTAAAPVKSAARSTKAVAAATPSTAKRSSEPVANGLAASVEVKKPAAGVRHGFKLHEYIVYPAHGVGQIVAIEEQEIAGMSLELFVITFEKDKMTLRVPTSKVDSLRKLSEGNIVEKAMNTLKGRARIKRTMWSRRAQEYENKINSGDLIAISEVVRDLYRSESQPEQSYSERQLYEAALDRMARELAAVEKIDERQATQRIVDVLSKSAKGRRLAEEEKAASEAAKDGDAEAA